MASKDVVCDVQQSSDSSSRGNGSIPYKKLIQALLAISLGTIIEWYDFTIYTQLSKTLSKVFFPSTDPALQALSFWGVYAVGYISRPVGAVLFGHLGDTKGRGTCLLISVLVMGIPTVLIGCLPSYHSIGIAAPVLLAALRLTQGLAMGGEFGAAMVYLHEIADPRYKSVTGSLGYISLGIGVVVGILMVVLVISVIPADALIVWGWRVPFLMAITTLAAAVILRYNMPESIEFATSREEIDEDYRRRLKQQQKNQGGIALGDTVTSSRSRSTSTDMAVATTAADVVSKDALVVNSPDCKTAVTAADVESRVSAEDKHYVPVLELFRGYWSGLLLQMGYEAWIGASFYLGYSWLPSFFAQYAGLSMMLTLWMVLTCMVLFTIVVPVAGYLSDRGQPRVTATICICVVAGAASVPMFLAFRTQNLAACWLLQAASLAMTGYTMGILPAICSSIYPAGVRISGFNLGYNLGKCDVGCVQRDATRMAQQQRLGSLTAPDGM
eukprot:GHRR01003524.1.p1 GENE.GHRR01003524.1~~GHRR01003524.1.p1  ORF type:complete len:498 (+),score=121.17 GHRR01003524.1:1133-2626(+)